MLIMLVNPQLGLICLGGRITVAEPDDCHGLSGYPTRKKRRNQSTTREIFKSPWFDPPKYGPNGMWKFPMKNQCFV